METTRLDANIKQTIDKYVEYDCLSRNKRERKKDRLGVVSSIREACQLSGVHSVEYIKYYYDEISKLDKGGKK